MVVLFHLLWGLMHLVSTETSVSPPTFPWSDTPFLHQKFLQILVYLSITSSRADGVIGVGEHPESEASHMVLREHIQQSGGVRIVNIVVRAAMRKCIMRGMERRNVVHCRFGVSCCVVGWKAHVSFRVDRVCSGF
jgi:hypothetical protein